MAKRFAKYQTDALKSAYKESKRLTRETKARLKNTTGLDMEQISGWYNRQRAQERAKGSLKELQRINAELKRSINECAKRETIFKERVAQLESENQGLKHRLAIAEGDIQFSSVFNLLNNHGYH